MPHYFAKSQKKLRREQRSLSRKQEGSSNYEKQKQKVARVYKKISNQRKDFLHKESKRLADTYDILCVESLNMKLIGNKHFGLGRNTMDNGYGMFLRFLSYKMEDRGKLLIKVDKWYASSQLCSKCGNRQPMPLKIQTYHCQKCGMVMDRDRNAAINIKREGLRIYESAFAA